MTVNVSAVEKREKLLNGLIIVRFLFDLTSKVGLYSFNPQTKISGIMKNRMKTK